MANLHNRPAVRDISQNGDPWHQLTTEDWIDTFALEDDRLAIDTKATNAAIDANTANTLATTAINNLNVLTPKVNDAYHDATIDSNNKLTLTKNNGTQTVLQITSNTNAYSNLITGVSDGQSTQSYASVYFRKIIANNVTSIMIDKLAVFWTRGSSLSDGTEHTLSWNITVPGTDTIYPMFDGRAIKYYNRDSTGAVKATYWVTQTINSTTRVLTVTLHFNAVAGYAPGNWDVNLPQIGTY